MTKFLTTTTSKGRRRMQPRGMMNMTKRRIGSNRVVILADTVPSVV
jgi:hypothetical protein